MPLREEMVAADKTASQRGEEENGCAMRRIARRRTVMV
jgi:hypothetical protein